MKFTITILGSNAALPTKDTITSAQVINVHDKLYIMDCGEGMQAKLELFGIKRNKIEAVFISHLHGDHILGLPGLLTSYAHFQRHKQLTIVGPKGIKELIQTFLRLSQAFISFEINFIELDNDETGVIYEDSTIKPGLCIRINERGCMIFNFT